MGLFNWLKKDPEIKKAEFVSPATGKMIPIMLRSVVNTMSSP